MKKLVLMSLLVLQGCATTPSTQFYSLEALKQIPSVSLQSGEMSKPLIGIAQFSLPSALERKQIVTRDANGTLHLAEQHQWAALLKQNMTEVLAKNLAIQHPTFWFKAYPWSTLGMVDYRLVIDVTQLDIVLGTMIHFSVDWTMLNEKTHTVLQHGTIDLNQPLTDGSYTTAVAGLNQLLAQLSERLNIPFS
ncbi:MAG: PqiC family protein [Methylococcales bacterium]|nr:PqiC family protein [Methylococcales bacterium]